MFEINDLHGNCGAGLLEYSDVLHVEEYGSILYVLTVFM